MEYNQPMQSKPREQFVQIPDNTEDGSTNPINQTCDSNQRRNQWPTIIISIIFAVTGQSIVRLLENYYYLHRNRTGRFGLWTRSLLQVVGFPILLLPFFVLLLLPLLSSKKRNQPPINTSDRRTYLKGLAIFYACIGFVMALQAIFLAIKHTLPFNVFTLIYTTQLLFTAYFSTFSHKINRWMTISLVFAILTGALTLNTFSAGSPKIYVRRYRDRRGLAVFLAACLFSYLLYVIMVTFDEIFSNRNESTNKVKPSFAAVLQLVIFSSLSATVLLVLAFFIAGEHKYMEREMYGFLKGEYAYLWTMVGLAAAWQIYWVGIVGLVYSVSAIFSNVISVCTWPVVSLLVALFYNKYEQFHVLSGVAFATAALSVGSYFYLIRKEKNELDMVTRADLE